MTVAQNNDAIVSPVGAVWRYLREHHPQIELYQADESHPSVAGTYAAACTFYAALLRKNPVDITFNSTLSATDANAIKAAAKLVVFDQLPNWFVGAYDPVSDFTHQITQNMANFTQNSLYAQTFHWDFGDGSTSAEANPQHTYQQSGNYTVSLELTHCGRSHTSSQTLFVGTLHNQRFDLAAPRVFPTLVSGKVYIQTAQNVRQVWLTDLAGRTVSLPFDHSQETVCVDVSAYDAAVYFLQITTDSNRFTTRIVKQ